MHELLAVCLLVVDRDSLLASLSEAPTPSTSPELDRVMLATLDRSFVEHDAFGLFQAVMKGAKSTYEWRSEEGPVSVQVGRAKTS
jgi:TBC1 domain family protein 5